MNGKQYVGRNASTFESYKPNSPVTGVRLLVDDENEYVAGDTEGNVWELTCPYGTQAMANNILASLSGKIYKGFEADNAVLTPSAELGDGVTVNGLYTMLAYRKVEFGPGHMSTIAAPGDNEPDEEYKYTPQKDREVNRKLAQTRSLITKSAEEIRLAIEATDGRVSELKVTLDGVTVTDESGTTRIKGSSIETGSIAAGSIRADQINMTGAISWGDLTGDVQDEISDRGISESRAQTLITSTLVSSPNIAGGTYYNLEQEAYFKMTTQSSGRGASSGFGYFVSKCSDYTPVFEIYHYMGVSTERNGSMIMRAFGNQFLSYNGDESYTSASGTWSFSNATVTGLTAVFG